MIKEFVTYEIALTLKELGFDEPCLACFGLISKEIIIMPNEKFSSNKEFGLSVPLWQQVIDWFREKHKLDIYIYPSYYESVFSKNRKLLGYFGIIQSIEIDECNLQTVNTYEEAREQAILKALMLCQK